MVLPWRLNKMTIRLEKVNMPYQIERIIRDWIPRNKPILNISIGGDGRTVTINYRQNKKEVGYITVTVGIRNDS